MSSILQPKIHISLPVQEGAFGGSHRFLGALRDYFISQDVYTQNPAEAGVILFSASQYIPETARLKLKYQNTVFVHRIDGPIRLYHKMSDKRDLLINTVNKIFADGTIFQSEWSKKKNKEMGMVDTSFETTIMNAPNRELFFSKESGFVGGKIKLVASSWSSYYRKGFGIYSWLDKNLDFSRFEFTFIGNSPVKFTNIISKKPLDPPLLAQELRKFDIFITASQNDPCSNSLVEALHSGLPSLVLNQGGHPELVRNGGETFQGIEDILDKVDRVVQNYEQYQSSIDMPSMEAVGSAYYNFCLEVYAKQQGGYVPKKLHALQYVQIQSVLVIWFVWRNFQKIVKYYEKYSKKNNLK